MNRWNFLKFLQGNTYIFGLEYRWKNSISYIFRSNLTYTGNLSHFPKVQQWEECHCDNGETKHHKESVARNQHKL